MEKKKAGSVHRLPITKARVNLGQLAIRVHVNKEYFILEKDGIPVVGMMDAEELEDYLEMRDSKVRSFIRKSHEQYAAGHSRPAEALLDELRKESVSKAQRRQKA